MSLDGSEAMPVARAQTENVAGDLAKDRAQARLVMGYDGITVGSFRDYMQGLGRIGTFRLEGRVNDQVQVRAEPGKPTWEDGQIAILEGRDTDPGHVREYLESRLGAIAISDEVDPELPLEGKSRKDDTRRIWGRQLGRFKTVRQENNTKTAALHQEKEQTAYNAGGNDALQEFKSGAGSHYDEYRAAVEGHDREEIAELRGIIGHVSSELDQIQTLPWEG